MTYAYSPEQLEIRDTFRRFLGEAVTSEYRRKRIEGGVVSDPVLVHQLRDMGAWALFEPDGSKPPSLMTLALLASECGRVLLPEALVESIVLGPTLIGIGDCLGHGKGLRAALGEELVSKLVAGELWCLGGELQSQRARFVLGGDQAAVVFLDNPGAGGAELYDVRDQPRNPEKLLDLCRRSETIALPASSMWAVPQNFAEALRYRRMIGIAAELAGVASAVVELTRDYVSTREQFDVPVGGFQAVQHKLADSYLHAEALSALVHFAAWAGDHSPDQLPFAAVSALRFAADVTPGVVETAIQLHGGIGFTWEYDLHLYLRRARTYSALASDAHALLDVLEVAAEG